MPGERKWDIETVATNPPFCPYEEGQLTKARYTEMAIQTTIIVHWCGLEILEQSPP